MIPTFHLGQIGRAAAEIAGAGVGSGWNPLGGSPNVAGSPANFVFSNGNRTLQTGAVVHTSGTIKGAAVKTAGKGYFEWTASTTLAGTTVQIGMVASGATLTDDWSAGGAGKGDTTFRNNGQMFSGSGATLHGSFGSWDVPGDVIGVAIDIGVDIRFYKNNVLVATVANATASVVPYLSIEQPHTGSLRCHATNQTYLPPTGYSAWDALP